MAKRAFIIGSPRSGTSMFRLLMNEHSEVVAPPECGFMQWLASRFGNWVPDDGYDTFVSALLQTRKFETWNLDKEAILSQLQHHQPSDYATLCESVYLAWDKEQGRSASVVVDKNNYYISHLDEIAAVWDDAVFIHLVRDCRGVVASYLDMVIMKTESEYAPKLVSDVEAIAKEWMGNVTTVQTWLEQQPENRRITLTYEELLLNPAAELTRVLELFDLNYEESMLDFHKSNRQFNTEPSATIDWKKKTKEPLDTRNVDNYKDRLTAEQLEQVTELSSSVLSRFGYV